MMKRIILLVLAIVFVGGSFAYSQELKPELRAKLKSLSTITHTRTKKERKQIFSSRKELFAIYKVYIIDEGKVAQKIADISNAQYKLLIINFENQIRIRQILNKEQFAILSNKLKEHSDEGSRERVRERKETGEKGERFKRFRERFNVFQNEELKSKIQEIIKNIKNNSNQLVLVYSVYKLDIIKAKDLINKIHNDQVGLLYLEHDAQKKKRELLTEDRFYTPRQ
jgi:Spy/CpxP family protein refolding chaperone